MNNFLSCITVINFCNSTKFCKKFPWYVNYKLLKKKYNSEIQILVDQTNCEVNSDFFWHCFTAYGQSFVFIFLRFFFANVARLTILLKLYSFSEHVLLSYGLKDTKKPKLQRRWILLRKFARFYKLILFKKGM